MAGWIAGIHQARKDASGDIHVKLDSSTPCWNDAIVGCTKLTETSSSYFQRRTRRYLGIKDGALVGQLYDLYLTRQSVDGSVDDSWMRGAIEFTQKTLGGAAKEVSPSQVFDFSLVQKAR